VNIQCLHVYNNLATRRNPPNCNFPYYLNAPPETFCAKETHFSVRALFSNNRAKKFFTIEIVVLYPILYFFTTLACWTLTCRFRMCDVQARLFRPASFRTTFIGPERRKNWAWKADLNVIQAQYNFLSFSQLNIINTHSLIWKYISYLRIWVCWQYF
jgi:hypothetical protein